MDKRNEKRSLKIGDKFGYLTIISYSDRILKNGKKSLSEWKCECECGNITHQRTTRLKKIQNISCGCKNKIIIANRFIKPNNQAAINVIYKNYRTGANRRNYDFLLTKDEFKTLIEDKCYYCGIEHSMICDTRRKIYSNDYMYNGIDRIDNNIGYIITNCVTCCKICNNAKNTLTKSEFINWISRVYNYQLFFKTFND